MRHSQTVLEYLPKGTQAHPMASDPLQEHHWPLHPSQVNTGEVGTPPQQTQTLVRGGGS